MKIKRTIAKIQIAQRKQQQKATQKLERRLALERNRALKDANALFAKAKAKEELRKAQEKKLQAQITLREEKAKQKKVDSKLKGEAKSLAKQAGKAFLKWYDSL